MVRVEGCRLGIHDWCVGVGRGDAARKGLGEIWWRWRIGGARDRAVEAGMSSYSKTDPALYTPVAMPEEKNLLSSRHIFILTSSSLFI